MRIQDGAIVKVWKHKRKDQEVTLQVNLGSEVKCDADPEGRPGVRKVSRGDVQNRATASKSLVAAAVDDQRDVWRVKDQHTLTHTDTHRHTHSHTRILMRRRAAAHITHGSTVTYSTVRSHTPLTSRLPRRHQSSSWSKATISAWRVAWGHFTHRSIVTATPDPPPSSRGGEEEKVSYVFGLVDLVPALPHHFLSVDQQASDRNLAALQSLSGLHATTNSVKVGHTAEKRVNKQKRWTNLNLDVYFSFYVVLNVCF